MTPKIPKINRTKSENRTNSTNINSTSTNPDPPASPQSTKHDITTADFKLFTVIWNQRMNLTTPQIHLNMADWLEYNWNQGNTRLLLMAFRSAGKSTVLGLFAAWLLYQKRNLRILVLAADHVLAKKMVRNVKRIIERHPLCQNMKPATLDQWASDRFTIKRMFESRDPSMMAKGISANITGSRADIIICDDVEVPNTCDTAEKRRDLRERLGEMEYVLTPDGTQLYVGTPHNYHTIYAEKPRIELGEEHAFLNNFKRLKIPILDKNGQSTWIEKYSEAGIKRIKTNTGPNKFASQMMLQPVNINEGRLNPDLLNIYDLELDYTKELNNTLYLSPPLPALDGTKVKGEQQAQSPIKLATASAFWDPSFASATGDYSVLAIIYTDDKGNAYLHSITYIKLPPPSTVESGGGGLPQDEATQQCEIVTQIAKAHYLPSLTIETNGLGKFLPNILRNTLAKNHVPCKVQETNQTQNKALRIIEAFDAILAARRLYVHKRVLKTPFMTEMQEWRPGSNKGHDDGLDAVASALAQSPIRLPRIYGRGTQSWMQYTAAHKAGTDFKI